MTRWAPLATHVFDALAAEILARSAQGRAVVAVDGAPGTGTAAFAAGLRDAVEARGNAAFLVALDDFRDSAGGDDVAGLLARVGSHERVVIVEGHGLLRPGLRDHWHYTAWLRSDTVARDADYERDARPPITATAIYDVTDPEHPRRSFADAC